MPDTRHTVDPPFRLQIIEQAIHDYYCKQWPADMTLAQLILNRLGDYDEGII